VLRRYGVVFVFLCTIFCFPPTVMSYIIPICVLSLSVQGVNPWIEVDGGVGPANAYKVSYT